jgi:hypothetical protein
MARSQRDGFLGLDERLVLAKDSTDIEHAMSAANCALDVAKHSGRNVVHH